MSTNIKSVDSVDVPLRRRDCHRCCCWIEVFQDYGPILPCIFQFFNEIELYTMEETFPDTIHGTLSGQQCNFLNQRDISKGTNSRWRQPAIDASTRCRGRDYVESLLFVKNRSKEARSYFNFDSDSVSANKSPTLSDELVMKDNTSMPLEYWEKWIHFDNNINIGRTKIIDVFVELSFNSRVVVDGKKRKVSDDDDNDDDRNQSWAGFRKAVLVKQQDNNNYGNVPFPTTTTTAKVKLELDSLVREMGWMELKNFRDQSQDYRQCHYDVSNAQNKMKAFMKNMQVTIITVPNNRSSESASSQRKLLIATGGYASPNERGSGNNFAKNANVAQFHRRHDRYPLEQQKYPPHHPFNRSRSTFLRIPTISNTDQSLEIIIQMQ